jgi:hypothetical protein
LLLTPWLLLLLPLPLQRHVSWGPDLHIAQNRDCQQQSWHAGKSSMKQHVNLPGPAGKVGGTHVLPEALLLVDARSHCAGAACSGGSGQARYT